jgi:integrase
MPRPRPPFLCRQVTQHGRAVWYVRVRHGPRIRLKAEYGSSEFWAAYNAAIAGKLAPDARPRAATGTLEWLWNRYRETSAWTDLSVATRRQRENIMLHVLRSAGAEPFARITKKHLVEGRDRRRDTPAQARNFLDAMRGLFRWALQAEHVAIDPTAGVRNPARLKGGGFPVWTEADVAAYEARWPVGTRQRVWLDVLLYTGLRRGDAVVLGRQHLKDSVATIRTEKSHGAVTVTIPILPVLAHTLEAGPTGDLAFICGERGKPFTKESFGNEFREAAKAAGLVGKSCHGVRKIGATRAAENGATVAELEALFGWQGGGMAALYTRAADRVRLAKRAAPKLERTPGQHFMPSPDEKVRALAPERKQKQDIKK